MTDPTITDLRRELEKARLALIDAQSHLSAHAHANAALHCATEVFYSPLHAKVTAAIAGIEHALARTDKPVSTHSDTNCPWAGLIGDFDRCEHGRHEGDVCGTTCGTRSQGNPHMQPGTVIGYSLRKGRIVMPHREDKYNLAAWYQNGAV
ncbi:hypothetical protein GPZ77_34300 (plasmid) [Streptomyces sp. QHH-9511]|uniref:hypothetical protein n=1 Tax=Streptomyces sp. QHH-9511 TaxID=2684468 RepID=UPI001317C97A|nr:hypothetical protein [Streptomyces sp. QHH-9511]QGZ53304.1 hypothetical protein GPZ77_34300 [Streptomyces sp. QHH-9511]